MFYDLEDPSEFIKHAADALDDDGIFVAQLMCSHSMFKTNDLETFVTNTLNTTHMTL